MNALSTWFGKRRGAAFGIVATGSSIGAIIFPIMTTQLIRRMGYPWAMRVCALMILALLVVANLTCRSRTPPHPQVYTRQKFARPFREAEFVLVAAGFLVLTWGVFVPINYLPSQAVALGLRADIVQYLVPILGAASLLGRVAAGVASDRYGRFNVFSILCSLSGVIILALWIPVSDEAGTIAFAAIYGFTSGAYISLMAPVVIQISPLDEIGLRSGLTFCVTSIAGLSTNPISGALLDLPTGWLGVKIYGGIMCIAGTSIIFMARIHRTGWKLRAVF
jgi:MFS family permease